MNSVHDPEQAKDYERITVAGDFASRALDWTGGGGMVNF
jgi:hypothetical protein